MIIHGLQKMTLLDFPGRVACTVFLGGCDMRCPFCHNAGLLDPNAPADMDEEDLLRFLEGRKGLLDGVAFTGGAYSKADGEVEIFRASGSLRGDTGAKWLDAAMRSGVSAEGTAETSVGQDGRSLLLEVRDSVTIEISVGAGESVVTNGVIRALSGDTLVVDVGEGGAFTATASVGSGAKLVKRGEGDLVLESAANRFSSVTNEAGMIVLRHPDALGGATVVASGDGIVYDFAEPAATVVWTYLGELIFNMLVLVGCVKMSDRVVREMLGL